MRAEPWQRATPGSACVSPLAAIDFRNLHVFANGLWSFGSLDVASKMWTPIGSGFVPKGLYDGSQA